MIKKEYNNMEMIICYHYSTNFVALGDKIWKGKIRKYLFKT